MRSTLVTDQQAVTLGKVSRMRGFLVGGDKTAIGIVGTPGRDALGDNPRGGILAQMNHLGAAIDLLATIGNGNRVEFANRIVPTQNAAWIFPGDG